MQLEQPHENSITLLKKCGKCGHVSVCAVFRAISPLLQKSWTEETRPLDPEDLAMICKEFIPASTLSILQSGSDAR